MSEIEPPLEVDPAAAEATALLERIRATPEPEPTGPSCLDIGKAACKAAQLNPHKLADLDDAGAKAVRRTLGMPDDAPVSNLDRFTAEALQSRAADRWAQLDARATAEGWRRGHHHVGGDYETWLAGRPMFDPTYRPPQFGTRPGMSPVPEPSYSGAAMDAALREAAIAARQSAREVEITGDRVSPHL